MTKERYFEMCKVLNSSPIDDEIPVELEDLPHIVQLSISIYGALRDEWDYMGGNFIGKSFSNLFILFDLFHIEESERLIVYRIVNILDNERRTLIRAKQK